MQRGPRVLIVEEEFLISLDIHNVLTDAGATDIATARDAGQARALGVEPGYFDLAIVEAHLGAPEVVAFCNELLQAGVAVVVTSADRHISTFFPGAVALEKPFTRDTLLAACRRARPGSFEEPTPLS